MATQAFIIQVEESLPDIDVSEVIAAFEHECRMNDGHPYRENRDYWGTLYMNCWRCRGSVHLAPLIEVLGREFSF